MAAVVAASVSLAGCGYNNIPTKQNAAQTKWADVQAQYQRRSDLIPNLVATVQGYAAQERGVLTDVTNARANATKVQINASTITDPQAFQQFQQAQGQLTQALKSLLVTVERYPELKSDANFRDLQAQLEGTENRITVARNRYIDAVREYNVTVREFPTNLTAKMFDYDVKPNFTVQNEAEVSSAPTVSFDTSTPSKPAGEAAPAPQPANPPAN